MSSFSAGNNGARPARSLVSRLIDAYNPGITILVLLWMGAYAVRQRLIQTGALTDLVDDALKSLLLVIPLMLAGWGPLVAVDRRFRLGFFDAPKQ
jgi:hypothetical protein